MIQLATEQGPSDQLQSTSSKGCCRPQVPITNDCRALSRMIGPSTNLVTSYSADVMIVFQEEHRSAHRCDQPTGEFIFYRFIPRL